MSAPEPAATVTAAPFRHLLLVTQAFVFAVALHAARDEPPDNRLRATVPERSSIASRTPEAPLYSAYVLPADFGWMAHSASVIELPDGQLRAVWYEGSREGASDVVIRTSVYDPDLAGWTAPRTALTTTELGDDINRYVRKLGNPVLAWLPNGELGMFVVSVSVGGWAMSRVNLLTSADHGETWPRARRLRTTPFLNLSTLVRGRPHYYANGDLALPAYQQFAGKLGELIRIDANLRVTGKERLSWGRRALQPEIAPGHSHPTVAFLRSAQRSEYRVLRLARDEQGNWGGVAPTHLPNPNSAVAALRLADGKILIALNNHPEEREDLTLAVSDDNGLNWKIVHVVEEEVSRYKHQHYFAYPVLLPASNGDIHLIYTWQKKRIKHVRFNRAWLDRVSGDDTLMADGAGREAES